MSELDPTTPDTPAFESDPYVDERYSVRNPRQIQLLLRALIDQRAIVSAHPEGNEHAFPTAILELDGDSLLLDGSPLAAVNRQAGNAAWLLCFAQVDRVTVRFRLPQVHCIDDQGRSAFRTTVPEEIHHLQRRDFYRLETPVTDSPLCTLRLEDAGDPATVRVVDISASGIALLLPGDTPPLPLQKSCRGSELRLPDGPSIPLTLVVCNQRLQKLANGTEQRRVGLRFEDLPRGADALIQRYIFRIDRERKARQNGDL